MDLLKQAMGNRSYGRGADPYCGGVDFEDEWSRPLLRPCHLTSSLASPIRAMSAILLAVRECRWSLPLETL